MKSSITISRHGDSWVADFSHADNASAVYRLFGTYTLPTGFRAAAWGEVVQLELERSNPGHEIVIA